MSSPAGGKKGSPSSYAAASPSRPSLSKAATFSSSPAASPSRYFKKAGNDSGSPRKDMNKSVRGGMRSTNSPASSPAREFKPKNESLMYSPRRTGKGAGGYSPAASPSRGGGGVYNVCASPIHPSMSAANIRSSRLGRQDSMPSNSTT